MSTQATVMSESGSAVSRCTEEAVCTEGKRPSCVRETLAPQFESEGGGTKERRAWGVTCFGIGLDWLGGKLRTGYRLKAIAVVSAKTTEGQAKVVLMGLRIRGLLQGIFCGRKGQGRGWGI